MSFDLIVVFAFGAYRVGDRISDSTLVAAITASEQFRFCVQVLHVGPPLSDTTAPTILTPAAQVVAENAAFSLQLTASEAATWAKAGGADAALFTLTTGGLLTLPAQDFEAPADADGDGVYRVTITATDAAGNVSVPLLLALTVTDVAEGAPSVANLDLSQPLGTDNLPVL